MLLDYSKQNIEAPGQEEQAKAKDAEDLREKVFLKTHSSLVLLNPFIIPRTLSRMKLTISSLSVLEEMLASIYFKAVLVLNPRIYRIR